MKPSLYISLFILALALTGCAVRTEISYNPTSGEWKYASGKNVAVQHTKTPDGGEQLIVTSDASSVVAARGEAAVAVVDAAGRVIPVAAAKAVGQ